MLVCEEAAFLALSLLPSVMQCLFIVWSMTSNAADSAPASALDSPFIVLYNLRSFLHSFRRLYHRLSLRLPPSSFPLPLLLTH